LQEKIQCQPGGEQGEKPATVTGKKPMQGRGQGCEQESRQDACQHGAPLSVARFRGIWHHRKTMISMELCYALCEISGKVKFLFEAKKAACRYLFKSVDRGKKMHIFLVFAWRV
jgi:hypothetical protein